ncbi:MAG: hypothetical protein PUP92_37520 [Rhizonema sp. PD38]|nr:hypothetical protein [Rhizonema sp. PD38]
MINFNHSVQNPLPLIPCGAFTRAALPEGMNPSGYGTRVVALVAVLSGLYRHTQRILVVFFLNSDRYASYNWVGLEQG